MKTHYTESPRGFGTIMRVDYNNEMYGPNATFSRLISRSSAVGDYEDSMERPGSSFLWVGEHHHLNREEVKDLINYMQEWLDTGRIDSKFTDPA